MNDQVARREVIAIRPLWAGYEREQVLEDINLTVYEGDFIGLIGPNGGGKTTLIRVLLGLLPPTRGEVRIMGRPVQEGRRMVGYVPQVVEFDREFPINVWDVARMGRLGQRRLLQRYTAETTRSWPRRCGRSSCMTCAGGRSASCRGDSGSGPTSPARW